MKKSKIALALAAVVACGTMTACTPAELLLGASFLAPTMIGYTQKSRVQSSVADAKTMLTYANQALAELDEEGVNITLDGWYDRNDENISTDAQWRQVYGKMCGYGDVEDSDFSLYFSDGICRGAVVKNGKFGIYPGILTADSYNDKLGSDPDFDDAKAAVEAEIAGG